MNRPRTAVAIAEPLAAAAAAVLATLPVWRMGWLRDDWFLLWQAVDPATAPPGAAGVFPRPAAALLWSASAALAGDRPWAMHGLIVLTWAVLAWAALRWHRACGGRAAGAVVVLAVLLLHGALVEPRLWAAAGNGVLAAALGLGGALALHRARGLAGRALGLALVAVAALARADAVVLLLLPLATAPAGGRWRGRWLAAVFVLGLLALAAMRLYGGSWALRPADGGRLLRLLVLPWGPPLPGTAAAAAGVAGLLAALAGGRLLLSAAPRTGAFLLAAGAVAAAGSAVDWAPSGRYVLAPAVLLALAAGSWWDGLARTAWPRPARLAAQGAVIGWIAVSLAAVAAGRTAADLHRRSLAETGLYRALRAELPLPRDHLTVIDPPPLGWTDSAADLENIASAAARRPVSVTVGAGDAHDIAFPVAVWRHGAWTVWTGRVPGLANPESR
ncbi:MAG TPA: hypothetical protein PLQ13_06670 [Candidatus Krumholzibacteria bacterium]|nr:hypothetical protein [Candidatus Krumholzibacteria bacterium]